MVIRRFLVALCAACITSVAAADAFRIIVDPECPAPGDTLQVYVVPGAGYAMVGTAPLAMTTKGNVVTLVAEITTSYFPEMAGVVATALPALSAGRYRVELRTRQRDDTGALGPELPGVALAFDVIPNPPACSASRVEVVGSAHLSTRAGTPYQEPMRFRVTDAHGYPVGGLSLALDRWAAPDERTGVEPPRLIEVPRTVTTDADGLVTVHATSNDVAGAFTYRASFVYAGALGRAAFVTLYNAPADTLDPTFPLVEYQRFTTSEHRHFFMTGNHEEMVKLDNSRDWIRTGAVLMAFPPGSLYPGAQPACRFYGRPEAGIDSHFFSHLIGECNSVFESRKDAWMLETWDAFRVFVPNVVGACPARTRPAYRGYNNQPDVNHRYALTPRLAVENGPTPWLNEGFGWASGPFMCLPQ